MTLAILNVNGNNLTLRFIDISEDLNTKSVISELPERNHDIVQSMGKNYRIFRVSGLYIGSDRATDRATLRNALNCTGSFTSEGVPTTTIYIQELRWRERGSRPLEYEIDAILIEET